MRLLQDDWKELHNPNSYCELSDPPVIMQGFILILLRRKGVYESYMEEFTGLKNLEHLKRSLEEAEIMITGMKLVLMNPSLNSERKGKYEKAFSKLNDEIRAMRIMMNHVRNGQHSQALNKNEIVKGIKLDG
jgi:hypothetical protein